MKLKYILLSTQDKRQQYKQYLTTIFKGSIKDDQIAIYIVYNIIKLKTFLGRNRSTLEDLNKPVIIYA